MNYAEKLKDPRWQRKRLEIMGRDNFTCRDCGDTQNMLSVHHSMYRGQPWEARDEWLLTLCDECHGLRAEAEADAKDALAIILAQSRPAQVNQLTVALVNMASLILGGLTVTELDVSAEIQPGINGQKLAS